MGRLITRDAKTEVAQEEWSQTLMTSLVSCNDKHTHPPKATETAAEMVKERMKERAKEETTPIPRIYHEALQEVTQYENIYKAVTLFKSEQAATEVSCSWLQVDCQPGGGENADFMRKDWQQSISEFLKAHSHWVSF